MSVNPADLNIQMAEAGMNPYEENVKAAHAKQQRKPFPCITLCPSLSACGGHKKEAVKSSPFFVSFISCRLYIRAYFLYNNMEFAAAWAMPSGIAP